MSSLAPRSWADCCFAPRKENASAVNFFFVFAGVLVISRHPRKCDGAGFEIRFVTSTFSSREQNLSRSDFKSLPSHCSWLYWSNCFVLLTCLYTYVQVSSVLYAHDFRIFHSFVMKHVPLCLFGGFFFKVGFIRRRLLSLLTDTNANYFVCSFT